MVKKLAVVTGATGAIGKAIAKNLALNDQIKVIILARDQEKAESAVNDIKRQTGNKDVAYMIADLSRYHSISALAEQWKGPLDILVNNAACAPRQRLLTEEGIEMQFATNVLGYFWMIKEMRQYLILSASARIINVASYWAGELDIDDPEFIKRRYDNGTAYRQSKQANRMLTVAFAKRFRLHGITVNSCHPGDVNSKLSNDLGFGGHETPDQAAATAVWLATSANVEEITGKYFEHMMESHCSFSSRLAEIDRLYELCESYTK